MRAAIFLLFLLFLPTIEAMDRPRHDIIRSTNDQIILPGGTPFNITSNAWGTIYNAWAKIFTTSPLVVDEGNQWISREGRLYFGTDFSTKIPPNDPGCGSTYNHKNTESKTSFSINNNEFASDVSPTFIDYDFKDVKNATANIILKFDITHTYTEHKHHSVTTCSGEGEDQTCSTSCESGGRVDHTDTLTITDADLYYFNDLEPDVFIRKDDVGVGHRYFEIYTKTPNDGFILEAGPSSFYLSLYKYNYLYKEFQFTEGIIPIYLLQAKRHEKTEYEDLLYTDPYFSPNKSSFYFLTTPPCPCQVQVFSHVGSNSSEYPAQDPLSVTINLTTEKRIKPGEAFQVITEVTPKHEDLIGEEIIVRYGSENLTSKIDAEGKAAATFTQTKGYDSVVFAAFKGTRGFKAAGASTVFMVSDFNFQPLKGIILFALFTLIAFGVYFYLAQDREHMGKTSRMAGFVFMTWLAAWTYTELIYAAFWVAVGYYVFWR